MAVWCMAEWLCSSRTSALREKNIDDHFRIPRRCSFNQETKVSDMQQTVVLFTRHGNQPCQSQEDGMTSVGRRRSATITRASRDSEITKMRAGKDTKEKTGQGSARDPVFQSA